jgi:SAM-dependent methyltransferase
MLKEVTAHFNDTGAFALRQRINRTYTVGPNVEEAVDRMVALQRSEDLLDVGCGLGTYLGRLREAGHTGRLLGVDDAEEMVLKAKNSFPHVEFQLGAAEDLQAFHHSFHVVTARHILFFFDDIDRVLQGFAAVLRPGGRLVATTRARGHLQEYWDILRDIIGSDPDLQQIFEEPDGSPFNDVTGRDALLRTFGDATVEVVENHFEFRSASPLVQFYNSFKAYFSIPDEKWAASARELERIVEQRLASTGLFRVQRRTAVLRAVATR